VIWNGKGITVKVWTCLGFLLVATAANAQAYTTVVNRDAKTVTATGPSATVTTTAHLAHRNWRHPHHDRHR
jgi:hypothetical protein